MASNGAWRPNQRWISRFRWGWSPRDSAPMTKLPCFVACSEAEPTSIPFVGKANQLAKLATYGSKLVAALDRQHPRDWFDVAVMIDGLGLDA